MKRNRRNQNRKALANKSTKSHFYSNAGGGYFGVMKGGYYDAVYNTPTTQLYGNNYPVEEAQMLPYDDRIKLIGYIRSAIRNDPRLASMFYRYYLGVGVPTPRVDWATGELKDKLECYLEAKLMNIRFGAPLYASGLHGLLRSAITERNICGEVFAVFMRNGQVRLIPSELCGSDPLANNKNERDGIIFNSNGTIKAYRFGRRECGTIRFDGKYSTVVPAEFVHHLGMTDRAEQVRPIPPLASAMQTLQDIKDVCRAKISQYKAQSTFAVMMTKNIPPDIASEISQSWDKEDYSFSDYAMARTRYQNLSPMQILYGENGEDCKIIESKVGASDFEQFMMFNLDFVCSVYGIPVEEALVGYRRSNYSSSRAEKLRWKQVLRDERAMWAQFLNRVQFWILQRGVILGEIEMCEPKGLIEWAFPPIEEIDQVKQIQADALELSTGLKSRAQILGERGRYSDEVDREIIEDSARRAKLLKEVAEKFGVSVSEIVAQLPNSKDLLPMLETIKNNTQSQSEVDGVSS